MRELARRLCRAAPLLVALAAVPPAATPDHAGAVLNRPTLSLALANTLATAALDACRAIGRTAVVAVVDRGGNLVAAQRGDDLRPHITAAAQRKAFTALSTKTTTILLTECARNDLSSQNLNTVGELLLLGGGVPVLIADQVIGAVGVAGAGGSVNDDSCATKALQARCRAARRSTDPAQAVTAGSADDRSHRFKDPPVPPVQPQEADVVPGGAVTAGLGVLLRLMTTHSLAQVRVKAACTTGEFVLGVGCELNLVAHADLRRAGCGVGIRVG